MVAYFVALHDLSQWEHLTLHTRGPRIESRGTQHAFLDVLLPIDPKLSLLDRVQTSIVKWQKVPPSLSVWNLLLHAD